LLLSLPSALDVDLIVVEHSPLVSAYLFASSVQLQQGFVKKDVTVGMERGLVYMVRFALTKRDYRNQGDSEKVCGRLALQSGTFDA
jgi:hypothetical protein